MIKTILVYVFVCAFVIYDWRSSNYFKSGSTVEMGVLIDYKGLALGKVRPVVRLNDKIIKSDAFWMYRFFSTGSLIPVCIREGYPPTVGPAFARHSYSIFFVILSILLPVSECWQRFKLRNL